MPSRPITGAELDIAVAAAFKKYGCTLQRYNLERVAARVQYLRDTKTFPEALRTALNEHSLYDERRAWYKTALGALFNSRKPLPRRGKVPKRNAVTTSSLKPKVPVVLEGNQYAIFFPGLAHVT